MPKKISRDIASAAQDAKLEEAARVERDIKKFLEATKGRASSKVASALTTLTPGVNWARCSKAYMADSWANRYSETSPHGDKLQRVSLKALREELSDLGKLSKAISKFRFAAVDISPRMPAVFIPSPSDLSNVEVDVVRRLKTYLREFKTSAEESIRRLEALPELSWEERLMQIHSAHQFSEQATRDIAKAVGVAETIVAFRLPKRKSK